MQLKENKENSVLVEVKFKKVSPFVYKTFCADRVSNF
jgi:hypothetical protein